MRKLATAAAVSLALASGGAFGLGLGDIEMRSALNQPMNAEIRLTSVRTGELNGMIVQLASADAFARAGIERSAVLTDLSFSIDQTGATPVIRIISRRPVVEPFLNFLLEVDWPQGRMVREYTVLLDPPVFMTPSATERNTTADQPALVQRGEEALVVPTPIERSDIGGAPSSTDAGEIVSLGTIEDSILLDGSDSALSNEGDIVSLTDLSAPNTAALEQREQEASQAFTIASIEVELVSTVEEVTDDVIIDRGSAPVARQDSVADAEGSTIVSLDDLVTTEAPSVTEYVTVNSGDTLFGIARDNALPSISVQQMMMALLAANESSFINSNINLVRAGARLRVPNTGEATQLSQTQAVAAIGEQTQLWQEYRDQLRNQSATQFAQAPDGDTNTSDSGSDSTAEVATDTPVETATNTTAVNSADAVENVEVSDSADSVGTAAETAAIETASLNTDVTTEELSAEARQILDNAREEIRSRDELKIVADNAPTSTTASATADETAENDAQRLGAVNRKLQLAREELSSSRHESDDLADQASSLKNTSENLDALVSLRQNEIAQLEAQLADARELKESAASSDVVSLEVAENTTDASSLLSGVNADATDSAENIVDSGVNALTEAGETLAQVELFEEEPSSDNTSTSDAVIPLPQKQTNWFEDLLDDPKRMMIAGIGGVGLLGVLGTLLFRRKRREDDDSMLGMSGDIEFIDDDEASELQDELDNQTGRTANTSDLAAAAGAGAFAGAAAMGDATSDDHSLSGAMDELAESGLDLGSETPAVTVADETANNELDKDDTISEVDVYLAYGLHGQAEDLLTKAIERKPDHQEYAQKLLQTYHAQGNGEGFQATVENFHARFGGESNPEWPAIAAMGTELLPKHPLFASALEVALDVPDSHDEATDSNDESDESALMDLSLDPAFAFDESDLEATGDFSLIANELAAETETDGSIDFPGFDDDAATSSDALNAIEDELLEDNDLLGEALTIGELDGKADDLTLDLDQLTGDLELNTDELLNADLSDLDLDTADLLNSELSDLELPEFAVKEDLTLGDEIAVSDSADEMDTMLDLAKAYIDMGDKDSASSALDEIVKSGSPEQISEAENLLRKIS